MIERAMSLGTDGGGGSSSCEAGRNAFTASCKLRPDGDEAADQSTASLAKRRARAARLSVIFREIEHRSGEPKLSAITVAASLGITPRYVHLLLRDTGRSFSHHVSDRRLDRAVVLLRTQSWRHRRISDIALEVGFSDLSRFNRAFRRRYGTTPTSIRAAVSGGAAANSQ